MRVTQSMLTNNLMRNLNNSYGNMSKLQEQINSGSKITRPSDDPVIAVKGMAYRSDLNKIQQFDRNMIEVNNWLDTTDSTLGEVGDALNRVKELLVQAANDTNTADDREKIKAEINQIREQFRDLGNTMVGNKYIFTGTNTQSPMFVNVEYFDHNAIQEHVNNIYKNLEDATEAYNAYPAGTAPAEIENAKLAAEDAVNQFETATDGTPLADPAAFEAYLKNNNIGKSTSKVVNAKYQDKDGNVINPFDGFKNMNLTITDNTTEPPTVTSKELPLFNFPAEPTVISSEGKVQMEVFDGIQLQTNTSGLSIFGKLDSFMQRVSEALTTGSDTNDSTNISELLGGLINTDNPSEKGTDFADIQSDLLSARADVGAKQNRVELMTNRLSLHEINVTKQLSENEDVDYAKAITELTTTESIHQASLSVGAKIIQQTLVDFIR